MIEQATDEMKLLFYNDWKSTGYEAHFQEVREPRGDEDQPYAQIFITHNDGGKVGLGGLYEYAGVVTVQIFTPSKNDLQEAYSLVRLVLKSYRGRHTESGVWFRNERFREIGKDGNFYQINVVVEFQYSEVT